VRARQRVAALLVLCDGIGGRLEAHNHMALFTAAVVGRLRELAAMNIGVAIQTICEGNLVARGRPGRNVTFSAWNADVLAIERICRSPMLQDSKPRRLPALDGVALGAFALLLPLGELSAVRIRRVTIGTRLKCDGLLEIAAGVAFEAIHFDVLAKQRIFCLRVVELLAGRNPPPTGGRVTGFTRLRKCAMMRVGVAIGALAEWNASQARGTAGSRRGVAFGARHMRVQSGQRKARLVMINLCRYLPIREVVALRAILPELSFVRILMATHALLREAQE